MWLEYPHVKAEQDEGCQDADGIDERHQDQEDEEATLRRRHLVDKNDDIKQWKYIIVVNLLDNNYDMKQQHSHVFNNIKPRGYKLVM